MLTILHICIHVHSAGIFLEKIPVGHMEDFYTLQGRRKLFHSVCVGGGGLASKVSTYV